MIINECLTDTDYEETSSSGQDRIYYVDQSSGHDSYTGTSDCPLKTIQAGLDTLINWKDQTLIIKDGIYQESASFQKIYRASIKTEGRVVIDGSDSVKNDLKSDWQFHSNHENGNKIYSANVGVDAWQLFVDGKEQIPARWPNADFENDDWSVFNVSHNWAISNLDREKYRDENNNWVYPYGNGELIDADGYNNHPSLKQSGHNATGAIAVLNIGSWKTWSRKVNEHDMESGTFYFDPVDGWVGKYHTYFLEQKFEFIDQPGEWFFDRESTTIFYMPAVGQNPNELDIRVKTRGYGLVCKNSKWVSMVGLEFFASTFMFSNCDETVAGNMTLVYPSTSQRSLGVWGENPDTRIITRFERVCSNSTIENSVFLYTDGSALDIAGKNVIIRNNYFGYIDWSTSDASTVGATMWLEGSGHVIEHNTVTEFGATG